VTTLAVDIVHTDIKKATDSAKVGAGFYMVDPTDIHVMPDFNVRVRSTDQWEAQVKALMDSIRENGFQTSHPISVVADATINDGQPGLMVVDGHTRLEAVYRLINEGIEIETVPVVVKPKSTTFEDMTVSLVTSNSGNPLTLYETSLVVKRLQNLGWEDAKIARRLGCSEKTVGNMTVLAGAPAKIRNQVVAGKLAGSEAIKLIRKHGGKAVEVVEAAAKEAKAAGKTKVTGKSLKKATAVPSQGATGPIAVTDRHAIDYACDVAADGLAWLKGWRAGDAEAVAELEAFVDPNGGL
jgi:ParB-like chromosome segregation protein Spo0J